MQTVMKIRPPIHIVWSTDEVDLADPFQRKWYIQQVLLHGRAEDLKSLDLAEVASVLDDLTLPAPVRSLWRNFLSDRAHAQR